LARASTVVLVTQLAATATVLYLTILTGRSFVKALTFDFGFDVARTHVFDLPSVPGQMDSEIRSRIKASRAMDSVRLLNGIVGVSASAFFEAPLVPLGSLTGWEDLLEIDGRQPSRPTSIRANKVSPSFTAALGAKIRQGSQSDIDRFATTGGAAVVNQSFAKMLAAARPTSTAIGARVRTNWERGTVVAVIDDLVYGSPTEVAAPQMFVIDTTGNAARLLVVKAATSRHLDRATEALKELWGPFPPDRMRLLRDSWRAQLAPFEAWAWLIGLIGWASALIALVGLSGSLFSYVELRQRELAIRTALGADISALTRLVLHRVGNVLVWGFAFGVPIGVASAMFLRHELFQVQPIDPMSVTLLASALVAAGMLAAILPVRHAAEIDVASVLKRD
jgi:hypothetical protein